MPEPLAPAAPVVYQLRIVLRHVSPLIWRRLLVPSDSTIADLHATLQMSTGELSRPVPTAVGLSAGVGLTTRRITAQPPPLWSLSTEIYEGTSEIQRLVIAHELLGLEAATRSERRGPSPRSPSHP